MPDLNIGRLVFSIILVTAMSIGFVGATQDYFLRKTTQVERILLFVGAICVIPAQYFLNIIGILLIGFVLILQLIFKQKEA